MTDHDLTQRLYDTIDALNSSESGWKPDRLFAALNRLLFAIESAGDAPTPTFDLELAHWANCDAPTQDTWRIAVRELARVLQRRRDLPLDSLRSALMFLRAKTA